MFGLAPRSRSSFTAASLFSEDSLMQSRSHVLAAGLVDQSGFAASSAFEPCEVTLSRGIPQGSTVALARGWLFQHDMGLQTGPGLEAIFTRNNQLRIGQREPGPRRSLLG